MTTQNSTAKHTPGPLGSPTWKVVGHPLLKDRHVLHENRYVMSSDAVIEIYDHAPEIRNANDWDTAWGLRNGVIICELRDSSYQKRYADLIAAAPELLDGAAALIAFMDDPASKRAHLPEYVDSLRAAIAKAEGRA